MKKRSLKFLSAMLMSGTMVITAFGTTAYADGGEVKSVTITKDIVKEENVYAPNTTFEFEIVPGTAVEAGSNQAAIYAGPEGGASFSGETGKIASAPAASDISKGVITAGNTQISIDSSKFTVPGIYRYDVTEKAGSYEGIIYSTETKHFDVYIDAEGNAYAYTFTDLANDKQKDDGVFENGYGKDPTDPTNPVDPTDPNALNNLTVTKKVEGTQGDKNKEFEFNITINGAAGEQYYMVIGTENYTLTSGTASAFKLKDGQTAEIFGLSKTDTYKVEETNYSKDGYTTAITGADSADKLAAAGTTAGADDAVIYTNTKDTVTPTGVIMTVAPYVLMVAAAGILSAVFLKRKRHSEF
ncbi:DUF7601 domain-containing protein [Novisyntrophococcus fermenticellae]|uniref:DUF7601 domain-containing protein n=1 Tax=Novisyntrophococcus fermenticellae TaxID=2068655 RepID=UPI001E4B985F|nr:FctA domain-containing protein [Novisyntrophococcus fermenticellae]